MSEQEQAPHLEGAVWRGLTTERQWLGVTIAANGGIGAWTYHGTTWTYRTDAARDYMLMGWATDERERAVKAADIIRTLLASAYPHPVEHPTMTAAWAKARAFLGEVDDDADPDGHAADDAANTRLGQ